MWYTNFNKQAQVNRVTEETATPPLNVSDYGSESHNVGFGEMMADLALVHPELTIDLNFLNWLQRRITWVSTLRNMYASGYREQAADWALSLYQNDYLRRVPVTDPTKLSPDIYNTRQYLMGSPLDFDEPGRYLYFLINHLTQGALHRILGNSNSRKAQRVLERFVEHREDIKKIIDENYDNPDGLKNIANQALQYLMPLYANDLKALGKDLNIDTLTLLENDISGMGWNPFNEEEFSDRMANILNNQQFDQEFRELFFSFFYNVTEFLLSNPEYREQYQAILLDLYTQTQPTTTGTKGQICLKISQHIELGLVDDVVIEAIKEDILQNDPDVYLSNNFQYLTLCEVIFSRLGGRWEDYQKMFLAPRKKYKFGKEGPIEKGGQHQFEENVIPLNAFQLGAVSPASIYAKMADIPDDEVLECSSLLFEASEEMLEKENIARCMGIVSNAWALSDSDIYQLFTMLDDENGFYSRYDHYNMRNRVLSQILKREDISPRIQDECIRRFLEYNKIDIDETYLDEEIDTTNMDEVLRQAQEIFDLDISIPVFRALGVSEVENFIFNENRDMEAGGLLDHPFAAINRIKGFGKEEGDPAGGLCVFFACNLETARLYQVTKARPNTSTIFMGQIDLRDIIDARILLGVETASQWRRQTYSYSEDPELLAEMSRGIPKNKREALLKIMQLHSAREITAPRSISQEFYKTQALLLRRMSKGDKKEHKIEIEGQPVLAHNSGWYTYFYIKG